MHIFVLKHEGDIQGDIDCTGVQPELKWLTVSDYLLQLPQCSASFAQLVEDLVAEGLKG